jgi:phosphopantetheinyl transferase
MPFTQDFIQIDHVKVHLLRYSDFDPSTYLDHLTDDEKERYFGFSNLKRKKEFTATRILRHRLFGFEHIHYNEHGAPYIKKEGFISISHAPGVVGIALCHNFKIGLDLEIIRPKAAKLADKFLSVDEMEIFDRTDHIEMTKVWSAKEVLYKLAGRREIHFKTELLLNKVSRDEWQGKIINPDETLLTNLCIMDHQELVISFNSSACESR